MQEIEVVTKTTSPEKDDVFEEVFMCPKCDHFEPIINSVEDCEELDEIGDEYGI